MYTWSGSEEAMNEDDLGTYQLLFLNKDDLRLVERILEAAFEQVRERVRGITPRNQESMLWPYDAQQMRTSPLGRSLLTIVGYLDSRMYLSDEQAKQALSHVSRLLYGDPFSDGFLFPKDFHTTDLGKLFHKTYVDLYGLDNLLTPKEVYTYLEISRQRLYNRVLDGTLHPIYYYDEMRFERSEIEAWKAERQLRQQKE